MFVLTGTSNAIHFGNGYEVVNSIPIDRTPDENWVAIWSRWPVIWQIEKFDKNRTTCAHINSPFGKLIVYGTILPYHMAGVTGNRYSFTGYKAWQFHMEDIISQSEDWKRIQQMHQDSLFFVIGDFNQSGEGVPAWYGTKAGRALLTEKLNENRLECITRIDFAKAGQLHSDPKKGFTRQNVDDIAVPSAWLNRLHSLNLGAWDNFTDEGFYLSDHNGVWLDFELRE